MTGGGLMQLVAYGAQDVYLTGNPQVTFFKNLYRRHTNFAMQSVEAQFNGSPAFGKRVSLVVPRVGDLMGRVWLQAQMPEVQTDTGAAFKWDQEVGNFLIKTIEVQIGGQVIDKQYGHWLSIWHQLTLDRGKLEGYNAMVGGFQQMSSDLNAFTVYVPLLFWFCQSEGLALPLIALQYHEVRIVVEFSTFDELTAYSSRAKHTHPDGKASDFGSGVPQLTDAKLYIDYIFLDTSERRKFAQTSHEYLITQVQYATENVNTMGKTNIKLNFNHPIKELIWVILSNYRKNGHYAIPIPANTTPPTNGVSGINGITQDAHANPVKSAQLQFNGHDRFSVREGQYFSDVQPYQHHKNIPQEAGINVYSFALSPEMQQPTGTANFSRIDNANLAIDLSDTAQQEDSEDDANVVTHTAHIFALNYNVLRIMSGMGGLAYSN